MNERFKEIERQWLVGFYDNVSPGTRRQQSLVHVISAMRRELADAALRGAAEFEQYGRVTPYEIADSIIAALLKNDAGNEKVAEYTGGMNDLCVTAPAPAPCLWRVHHETRNGPLYVSQCDGEWRHATADPKCPSCGKPIKFTEAQR